MFIWFPLSRNFSVRTHVNFTRVNKIEAMYGRPYVNVKVERGSTLTFTRILFTRVKFIENTSWKVLAYGIYARVVDVSEILLVRCAHSFDFWYKNNECVNTVQSTFHVVLCLLYTYWDIHHFGGLFILNLSKMLKFAATQLLQNDNENEVSAV